MKKCAAVLIGFACVVVNVVAASPAPHIDFSPEPTASAQTQTKTRTPAEIARGAFPSVVLLAMQDDRGQPISLGSGFFVEKDIVATNYHVLEGATSGYAKITGQPAKLPIKGIVAVDPIHDLALLQLSGCSAAPLPVATTTSISTGDAVFAIGNPRGLEGTFSSGIVSSVRKIGSDRILQITAPISPGSSGGPVLDQTAIVVGVSVASITNGQNLNFAIPADYLGRLQKSKTELRPLKAVTQQKNGKTILHQLGSERAREGVAGNNLTYDDLSTASGRFSYSLQNRLPDPVKDVVGVIVFYSVDGEPLEIVPIRYDGVIPPGLAKRITGVVDVSVMRLNWNLTAPPRRPKGKVEFRILDFLVSAD